MKNPGIILALLFFLYSSPTDAQYINSIAKTGKVNAYKDWYVDPWWDASLSGPGANDIAFDSTGNIFYTDSFHVLKLNKTTGALSIIAGQDSSGFGGDNGLAVNSILSQPTGIVIDHANNIIFVDAGNFRIRKINQTTGIITTLAGTGESGFSGDYGLAINAQISFSYGITVDDNNNILFADVYNNRIRKINTTSGTITTIVGNGVYGGLTGDGGISIYAPLAHPYDVALNKRGDIFIADFGNFSIRKVDISTYVISTIAGAHATSFGDGVPALYSLLEYPNSLTFDDSDNLYVLDNAHVLRKIKATNQYVYTIAGKNENYGFAGDGGLAASALLKYPIGLAFDKKSKNIYINDYGNNRIREVSYVTTPPPVTDKYKAHCPYSSDPFVVTGSNLKWYTVPFGGTYSLSTPVIKTSVDDTTVYFVSQTIGGIESQRSAIVSTTYPVDSATIRKPLLDLCFGTTANDLYYAFDYKYDPLPSYIRLFSDSLRLDSIPQTEVPFVLPEGRKKYYVSIVNQYGCEGPLASFEANVHSKIPTPTLPNPTNLCLGTDPLYIIPRDADGTGLSWFNSDMIRIDSLPVVPSRLFYKFTYYVMFTDTNYCRSDMEEIKVIVYPTPLKPSVYTPLTYCQDVKADPLSAQGTSLLWYDGDNKPLGATSPIPSTAEPGLSTYFVSQTNEYNCEGKTQKIEVLTNPKPSISINETVLAPITGIPVELNAVTDEASQTWNDGSTQSKKVFTPENAGEYKHWVRTISKEGCYSDTVWHTINIWAADYWKNNVGVYPNPFADHINITGIDLKYVTGLRLSTSDGKLVFEREKPITSLQLDLPANLPIGNYLLEIQTVGSAIPTRLLFKR